MKRNSSLYRCCLLLCLFIASFIGWATAASGQIPLPTTPPVYQPPDQVKRFGAIEVTMVDFQGQQLFYIVSPTVADRQNPGEQIPVEVRAKQIEANLNWVIAPNVKYPTLMLTNRERASLDSLRASFERF